MPYSVYIIQSDKNGSLYKGITNNIERRLRQHNAGKNSSTRSGYPYRLVYFEECSDRKMARLREKYFKSGIGREELKRLIHIPL